MPLHFFFVNSIAGVLSLLDEKDESLQTFALEKLNTLTGQFWAEIADSISKIEILYENKKFKSRQLAAMVASKVYFHLGALDDALTFALGAEKLFNLNDRSEYVESLIWRCIDKYKEAREAGEETDPALVGIVERMFDRCFQEKEYKQAIGIALETRRIDIVKKALLAGDTQVLGRYVLDCSMSLVTNFEFRKELLQLLVDMFSSLSEPDYVSMSECFIHLSNPRECASLLKTLLKDNSELKVLMAYQIAFNLDDNATQSFLRAVLAALPEPSGAVEPAKDDESVGFTGSAEDVRLANVRNILSGATSIQLYLEFLSRANNTDLLILKRSKQTLDGRSSAYHQGVTFANAFMNSGTTSDDFLRQNLEWLSKASNWAKFSATAALGVINKGQIQQGESLLAPYLPKEGVSGSPYSEGGALFALGLIHANHGVQAIPSLTKALRNATSEVVQHGGCLGLGVAGMASADEAVFEDLRNILFTDSAVAGEAAGMSMGLVMMGTGLPSAFDDMLQYAHETQHEKIIRGLAIGMALLMYNRQEQADDCIALLLNDKDSILRYGGVHMIALAYAGTSSNKAIRQLLHLAVSDVNDDVRRAAVTALGFILFKQPEQVPRIVQLLSESYNPHVRYGAALALGVSCAGTALPAALELLEPLTKDPVDYVRQGALIATAMLLVQHNDTTTGGMAGQAREKFAKIIADKHVDAMAKFGSVLSQGILDAGGRNVTISLSSRNGQYNNLSAIVGMVLFTQFWYWYPLALMLNLSFTPTVVLGLDSNLKMPRFTFKSDPKPSMFAYPPALKEEQKEKVEKVATAVLSTTARAKAREAKKEKAAGVASSRMDVDSEPPATTATPVKTEGEPKLPEPSSETLNNLTRVVPFQLKHIEFTKDSKFVPVHDGSLYSGESKQKGVYLSGIILGKVTEPSGKVEYLKLSSRKKAAPASASSGGATAGTPSNAEANNTGATSEAAPPSSFEMDEDL